MEPFEKENRYLRAKERVTELKEFYGHLTSFILVNSLIAGLNYFVDRWAHPWFLWALIGWGIGLFFHAARVFAWNPLFTRNWEERKIKQFMEEEEALDQKYRKL